MNGGFSGNGIVVAVPAGRGKKTAIRFRFAGLFAAILAGLAAHGGAAQTRSDDGPVVYCRDAVRQIVTRSLARDCPQGGVITEKEAEALKNESVERRRRLMFGEKPEAVPAAPVEPVREAPAERAPPPAPPPAVQAPPAPRPAATPPSAPRPAASDAKAAPEPVATAPEAVKPQAETPPRASEPAIQAPPAAVRALAPSPGPAPPAAPPPARAAVPPPPPLSAEFREVQALVAAMKPGEFRAVGKNTMRDVVPHLCNTEPRPSYCAVQGPLAVMSTWGGGAFDTKRNILLITGGGHNDYGGNEVYHFRLDTLRWERATDPSPMAPTGRNDGSFRVTDGTEAPVSFHSYDGLVYVPSIDRMFALPQASYQSGNSYDNFAYFYDPGGKKWVRGAKPSFGIGPNAGCDYWPKADEIVCSTPNGLASYNPAAKAWKLIGSNDNQDFGRTAIVDPVRNIFVQVWGKERAIAVYDLSSPSPRRTAAPIIGNAEFGSFSNAGLAYHPPTGRYVVWPGGPEVWTVEPGSVRWQATKYTAATGPAYRSSFIGVYGKWQYVPSLDAFIGVRWWDEPVYLYKLPRPGEVAGDTRDTTSIRPPSAVVAGLRDGQTIDLPKGRFRDAIVIKANNVTIRGYDTVLFETAAESKAAIINNGRDNRIEGLTVENARGSGNTGCVYHGGTNLTMFRVTLRGCEMNVRTNNGDERGFFHFDQSVSENSVGSTQLGHNFYINQIPELRITNSRLIGCGAAGHVLKSRAKKNIVENSVLAQLDRHCSRIVDFSQGGDNVIRRSFLEQGPRADNADMIGDAREAGMFQPPLPEWAGELLLEDNVILSDWSGEVPGPGAAQIAIVTLGGKKIARFRRNKFVMPGPPWRAAYRWPDAPAERFVDAGGNTWLVGRAAAGLQPFPFLPALN
jgi:hypothetical protein